MSYSIGVDYGIGSGRAFLVDTTNGKIIDKYIKPYTHGTIEKDLNGVKLPHSFSLQNGNDYMEVLEEGVPYLIQSSGVKPEEIVGIGIDFTSSTVMFTDENLEPIHNYLVLKIIHMHTLSYGNIMVLKLKRTNYSKLL